MIVRIRFPQGRPLRLRNNNSEFSAALGALLVPGSLMAYSLGFWRLASDMGLAAQFDITGAFSHWQLWIGLGVMLHAASITLSRHGRGRSLQIPEMLGGLPQRRGPGAEKLQVQARGKGA